MNELWSTEVETIRGERKALAEHQGKVLLIVNTASKCGFTPQYAGLEELWKKHRERGLVVLGFPCDQFGHQEPGSEEEIESFCQVNYGVSFPLHKKVEVNGPNAHPLFQQLKREAPGVLGSERIKWNFTKFLVDRAGRVKRFAPTTKPGKLEAALEASLAQDAPHSATSSAPSSAAD